MDIQDIKEAFIFVLMIIVGLIVIFAIVIMFVGPLNYYTSLRQARVYNEINGTDFDAWDFFWAGSQINSNTQTLDLK